MSAFQQQCQQLGVWRGQQSPLQLNRCDTGFPVLNSYLQGGWPQHGVVELLSAQGIGELRLVLPAMAKRNKGLLVFINPPALPNAEALGAQGINPSQVLQVQSQQHSLWTAEQCLSSGCCSGVLLWQQAMDIHQLKRLEHAAEQGQTQLFMFNSSLLHAISLPLSMRLQLSPSALGLRVELLKQKGGWAKPAIELNLGLSAGTPALAGQLKQNIQAQALAS